MISNRKRILNSNWWYENWLKFVVVFKIGKLEKIRYCCIWNLFRSTSKRVKHLRMISLCLIVFHSKVGILEHDCLENIVFLIELCLILNLFYHSYSISSWYTTSKQDPIFRKTNESVKEKTWCCFIEFSNKVLDLMYLSQRIHQIKQKKIFKSQSQKQLHRKVVRKTVVHQQEKAQVNTFYHTISSIFWFLNKICTKN